MVALTQATAIQRDFAEAPSVARTREYRLFWRTRADGAWRREEFDSRDEAFDRYFYLAGRGVELRWRAIEPARAASSAVRQPSASARLPGVGVRRV